MEILALAEAPRGSFYFHFPDGKEQLVAEAVDRHSIATAEEMVATLDDRSIPISRRVEGVILAVADSLAANDYRLGCAVAATSTEASATSPSLREATDLAFDSWTTLLSRYLVEEGIGRERALALADTVVAGLEGATIMARSKRDAAPLRHVATTLGATVEASLE